MKELNPTTAKARSYMHDFTQALYGYRPNTLNACYGHCSSAKIRAFENCVDRSNELNGEYPRVIRHNSQCFTVGYLYYDETAESYEPIYNLVIETRSYRYLIRDYFNNCPIASCYPD